jgi:hypothetical protein
MLLLGPKPPPVHYPAFIVSCDNFVQKVIPQVKKLFIMDFKDLYVSQVSKNLIIIPQAAHQVLGMCFHVGFLRFTPPLSDYSHIPSTWDSIIWERQQGKVCAHGVGLES